jgi:hypothetical protein
MLQIITIIKNIDSSGHQATMSPQTRAASILQFNFRIKNQLSQAKCCNKPALTRQVRVGSSCAE